MVKFHATNENPAQVRFDALEDWLAEQLQANKPWDEIVTGMITATGRNDENGAVAFPLAYEAQPVEMAGEVSRIFLGVQIQCAQCHDHKTDSWKRQQFHEFAAFFAGVRPRQSRQGGPGQLPVFAVVAQGPRRYTMPDKENPAKQIPDRPALLPGGSKSKPEPALPETLAIPERRALAASYVTGQDNPWFARAFVNRIWYALMGEAFYEPIDDIGPERTPKAPEVLEPLAEQWQRGGYDVRWLFRTILNTAGLSAAGPLDGQRGGQDPVRLELPEPAPRRPDLRRPGPGPGTARWTPTATRSAPSPAMARTPRAGRQGSSPGDPKPGDRKRPSADQGRGQEGRRGRRAGRRRSARKRGRPCAAGRTSGCCSTASSASIPRSPTTTSSARSPRPCS